MIEVPICDSALGGGHSITGYPPTLMRWNYSPNLTADFIVLTDSSIKRVEQVQAKRKIALLIEPRDHIDDSSYLDTKRLIDHFDYVLSYDRRTVAEFGPKGIWYPIGGCWIPPEERRLDYRKSKTLSIIASTKVFSVGHMIRHAAVVVLRGAEVFGRGYRPIKTKTEALAPFLFSFVTENCVQNTFFTEKLIDCFVTGCVPIYYGCDDIGEHFSMNGILKVNNLEQARDLLRELTVDKYMSMRPAVEENFARAQEYLVAEDWICKHHPHLFV